ncbi:MAG: Tab2/Atab2 family RNA-binding protein [Xenococcaceae cyanobacterium]
MSIWQVDFYQVPDSDGEALHNENRSVWELLVCDSQLGFIYDARCPRSQLNSDWLVEQLKQAADKLPNIIRVFRPQAKNLLTVVGEKLNISVEASRHTTILKQELLRRGDRYGLGDRLLKIEQLPPQGLPENLWGEEWRFVSIAAGDLVDMFSDRPIPVLDLPEFLFPINLNIASNVSIPGVVIYGGRRSMQLARWLQQQKPAALNYIPTEVGKSGGLVLESGLSDRWIVATFDETEVAKAAQTYEQQKIESQQLHFLLVQPDDSGMTYSGFWLLREE